MNSLHLSHSSQGDQNEEEDWNDSWLEAQMQSFWTNEMHAVEKASLEDMRQFQLPYARIKKIMKMDENIKNISAETPALFSKACELFILDLTLRSWAFVAHNTKRKTLQRTDIIKAVSRCDMFDFLIDTIPREDVKRSMNKAKGKVPYQEDIRKEDNFLNSNRANSNFFTFSNSPQLDTNEASQQPSLGASLSQGQQTIMSHSQPQSPSPQPLLPSQPLLVQQVAAPPLLPNTASQVLSQQSAPVLNSGSSQLLSSSLIASPTVQQQQQQQQQQQELQHPPPPPHPGNSTDFEEETSFHV